MTSILPPSDDDTLADLKARIQTERLRVVRGFGSQT